MSVKYFLTEQQFNDLKLLVIEVPYKYAIGMVGILGSLITVNDDKNSETESVDKQQFNKK